MCSGDMKIKIQFCFFLETQSMNKYIIVNRLVWIFGTQKLNKHSMILCIGYDKNDTSIAYPKKKNPSTTHAAFAITWVGIVSESRNNLGKLL